MQHGLPIVHAPKVRCEAGMAAGLQGPPRSGFGCECTYLHGGRLWHTRLQQLNLLVRYAYQLSYMPAFVYQFGGFCRPMATLLQAHIWDGRVPGPQVYIYIPRSCLAHRLIVSIEGMPL